MNQDHLTTKQKDFAIFLPAISTFYSTFIGKQRFGEYVDYNRIPTAWTNGVETLNFLNAKEGLFPYKWALYSAGHAELDLNKGAEKEDMIRNRDRSTTFLLGDSGGFQIGKGIWEGDWKDPNCPKAQKKREQVLAWMDKYMDYGMVLDIPAWVRTTSYAAEKTGITTYQDAVNGTRINNDYFMKHRTGACKFLNVLQGENHSEAEDWYLQMRDYCDPNKYPETHFNGWAMGGQNMCDIHLILRRMVALHFDGLLQEGVHDWMHFLGTSKLEWAVLLTDIMRAVRANYNPRFTISFDCASPFLATANGQVYTDLDIQDKGKWTYRMRPSIDDKSYATDSRLFGDVALQDQHFDKFDGSPLMDHVRIKDICVYKPGDLNKVGKEGKTSWDSFSYAIQMGHNIWTHINAVQQANEAYDAGLRPGMLIKHHKIRKDMSDKLLGHNLFEEVETQSNPHGEGSFRDIINSIFAAKTREEAYDIIESHKPLWTQIIGTRGASGKKATNAATMFEALFIEGGDNTKDDTLNEDALNQLEHIQDNEL